MSTLKTNRIENLTTTDGGISIDNGGNVGIGTSAPNNELEVVGGSSGATTTVMQLRSNAATASTGTTLQFLNSTAADSTFGVASITALRTDTGASGSTDLLFNTGLGGTVSEQMRIDSSGRVGIGTAAPSAHIESEGNVSSTTQFSGFQGLRVQNANGAAFGVTADINFVAGTGSDNRGAAIGVEYMSGSKNDLYFATSGGSVTSTDTLTERMRIDSSGNVIIGTAAAATDSRLTVRAVSPALSLYATPGNESFLNMGDTDDHNIGRITYDNSNNAMRFDTNAAERIRITSAGLVGIGVNSPTNTLHVVDANGSSGSADFGATGNQARIYADSNGIRFGSVSNHPVILRTNGTERMRITSAGYAKCSDSGSYYNSGASYHEFNQSINAQNTIFRSTNSSYTASQVQFGVARAATSSYWFLQGVSGWGSGNDTEFYIRGDGYAYIDGAWNGGGADYAEYFEWSDGNTEAEDRRGISVVLDGDKIREAVEGEEPIGVISGNPSVVGDADVDRWKGKYLRDDYGSYVLDEDGYRQLNPDYDSSVEYVQRENRPEWDCVGLMGKLRIRKGQVTGSRWIKMRDISDSVEEWLVR